MKKITTESLIREENTKQSIFVYEVSTKYLSGFLGYRFDVTKHFTERLVRDRRDSVSIYTFCCIVGKLFAERLCELLYAIEFLEEDRSKIVIVYKDTHIVLKVIETSCDKLINFMTVYKQQDLDYPNNYYILTLKEPEYG